MVYNSIKIYNSVLETTTLLEILHKASFCVCAIGVAITVVGASGAFIHIHTIDPVSAEARVASASVFKQMRIDNKYRVNRVQTNCETASLPKRQNCAKSNYLINFENIIIFGPLAGA